MLLIETVYDLLQAKAAINGARAAMRSGRRRCSRSWCRSRSRRRAACSSAREIGAALTALEAMQPDVIGMNCATGPAEMTEHLRYLAQHARTFLSALPNAGLPSVVDGHTHYDLTPDALAEAHERFVERVRAQHRRRLLRHDARAPARRSSSRLGDARAPVRAHARVRARLLVDLLARAVPPGARVPRGRRAHQRQRLPEVPRRDARSRLGHAACRWRASR